MQGQKGKCKDDIKSYSLDRFEQVERSKKKVVDRYVPLTNGFANTISTPSSFTQASLLAQRRKIVGKGNTYFFRMDASTEMILGRQFFCRQQYKTMTGRKRK